MLELAQPADKNSVQENPNGWKDGPLKFKMSPGAAIGWSNCDRRVCVCVCERERALLTALQLTVKNAKLEIV